MFKKKFLIMVYIIGCVLSPYLANPVYAQTTILGPEFYVRRAGKPQKVIKNFFVQNLNQEFTLSVQNGEGKGGRVSSAVIELNGVRIVGPDEFNKQVATITKPITLKQQNEIAIEVRSEPGTSIVVTILGSLPSMADVITPQGGTIDLAGYASVVFPAGAVISNQSVTLSATVHRDTQAVFDLTSDLFSTGPRVPYELRINSGNSEVTKAVDLVVNIPDTFIASLPLNAEVKVFAQIFQEGGEELLDNFVILPSRLDLVARTVHLSLPTEAFTNWRNPDRTYEAIVVVGSTVK